MAMREPARIAITNRAQQLRERDSMVSERDLARRINFKLISEYVEQERALSINDPIILRYDDKEGREWYYLTRGGETFYDSDRHMRVWTEPEGAIIWCEENLGQTPRPTSEKGVETSPLSSRIEKRFESARPLDFAERIQLMIEVRHLETAPHNKE